jgi:hypothetical protein
MFPRYQHLVLVLTATSSPGSAITGKTPLGSHLAKLANAAPEVSRAVTGIAEA